MFVVVINKVIGKIILHIMYPPCIHTLYKCVQYIGGLPYIGGMFSTSGGSHDACGGYHDACGDIMMHVGGIS